MAQEVSKQNEKIGISRERRHGALVSGGPSTDMPPDLNSKPGKRIRNIAQSIRTHQDCIHCRPIHESTMEQMIMIPICVVKRFDAMEP